MSENNELLAKIEELESTIKNLEQQLYHLYSEKDTDSNSELVTTYQTTLKD